MPSLNKVLIIGHLGAEPEIRRTDNTVIANLSVASSDKYKDKTTGELKQNTEWHKVVLFNKTAEFVEKYLKKGDAVYVEGRLKTDKYTDKNKIERYATKIIASNLQKLSGKDKDTNEAEAAVQQDNSPNVFDDDIPF